MQYQSPCDSQLPCSENFLKNSVHPVHPVHSVHSVQKHSYFRFVVVLRLIMKSPGSSNIKQTSKSTHIFGLPSPYVFPSSKIHQQYDRVATLSEKFLHHELVSSYEARLSTFISWPHQTPPHVLAAAGFFRLGQLTPTGRDIIECAFCGVRSINNARINPWKIHEKQCSMMLTTFKCRRCPEKFTSNSKLHRHVKDHHSKRAFDCSVKTPPITPSKTPAISPLKIPAISPPKTPAIHRLNIPAVSPPKQPPIELKTSTFQKASAPPSPQITRQAEPVISPLQGRPYMTMIALFRKFAARGSPVEKPAVSSSEKRAIKTWQWSKETGLRLISWTELRVAGWLDYASNLLESKSRTTSSVYEYARTTKAPSFFRLVALVTRPWALHID